uniref:Uncharacterized protein n=1 Tax=Triticum urartu TaxID=4572 RepID=A0A8R7UR81_TRIUA
HRRRRSGGTFTSRRWPARAGQELGIVHSAGALAHPSLNAVVRDILQLPSDSELDPACRLQLLVCFRVLIRRCVSVSMRPSYRPRFRSFFLRRCRPSCKGCSLCFCTSFSWNGERTPPRIREGRGEATKST